MRKLLQWGLAALALVPVAGVVWAAGNPPAQPQFTVQAPAGFADEANTLPERVTVFRGQRQEAITWLPFGSLAGTYNLSMAAVPAMRRVLVEAGFDPLAIDSLLTQAGLRAQNDYCVARSAAPQTCAVLRLDDRRAGVLEVLVGEQEFPIPDLTTDRSAYVGSTNVFLGGASPTNGAGSSYLGLGNRGLLSYNAYRLEYDANYSANQDVFGRQTEQLSSSLLAAGAELPQGGVAYAGFLRAGMGAQDAHIGAVQAFFAKPSMAGLAWKSDASALGASASNQFVEVDLTSAGFVMVLSEGVVLAQGQYGAGRHKIGLSGFAPTLVEVQVRDNQGAQSSSRKLVQSGLGVLNAGSDKRSYWYLDSGQVANSNTLQSNGNSGLSDVWQTTAAYTRAGTQYMGSVGAQEVNGLARVAGGVGDVDRHWSLGAMLGGDDEQGWQATTQWLWGPLSVGGQYTRYQAPRSAGAVSARCNVRGLVLCMNSTLQGYESTSLTVGIPAWRTNLSLYQDRFGQSQGQRVGLSSSLLLQRLAPGAQLFMMASHDVLRDNTVLNAVLLIPLDWRAGVSTMSQSSVTAAGGQTAYSTGFSSSYMDQEDTYLRQLSANVAGNDMQGTTSVQGNAAARFGAVDVNATATQTPTSTYANMALATTYGVSGGTMAFTRSGQSAVAGNVMEGGGTAHVAVVNRSYEDQRVSIQGRTVEVAARSNVLVPVRAGFVRDITVTPGPVANEDAVAAGQLLYKGNIEQVVIAEGFWVVARFVQADDAANPQVAALPVQFTYKAPGQRMERLYTANDGSALLYETNDSEESSAPLVRYVTVGAKGVEVRCTLERAELPAVGDYRNYKTVTYQCESYMAKSMKFARSLLESEPAVALSLSKASQP